VALYLVYNGLGASPGLDLLIKAMFILAVSSLIGSATGLPGGLGTADGSMLGLTRVLISTSATLGGAATLLIRLCTLWFGLLIGVGALLTFRSIQRVDVSITGGNGWEELQHKTITISPMDGRYSSLETASASANTGEKIV
jgi:uncharacterized membrane protein YbhN (UPF0104 family)